MFHQYFIAALLLPVTLACASTTFEVPASGAANPRAPSMPVAGRSEPLGDDFDAWDTGSDGADPHAQHHGAAESRASDSHDHHSSGADASESHLEPEPKATPEQAPEGESNASEHEGHQHD